MPGKGAAGEPLSQRTSAAALRTAKGSSTAATNHPDAIPTETYVGGTKTVEVRGRRALLTHATNAHTDGDSWIYLADADVIFTGDLFYNNPQNRPNARLTHW